MIQFEADGKMIEAEEGETILTALRRKGVRVPTLCHMEGLTPTGACRLCIVEVLDTGGDLGPAERKRRAKDVVPRDHVARAPLDNYGFLKAEPCEARRDRCDVTLPRIARMELDGVDRDDERP